MSLQLSLWRRFKTKKFSPPLYIAINHILGFKKSLKIERTRDGERGTWTSPAADSSSSRHTWNGAKSWTLIDLWENSLSVANTNAIFLDDLCGFRGVLGLFVIDRNLNARFNVQWLAAQKSFEQVSETFVVDFGVNLWRKKPGSQCSELTNDKSRNLLTQWGLATPLTSPIYWTSEPVSNYEKRSEILLYRLLSGPKVSYCLQNSSASALVPALISHHFFLSSSCYS